MVFKSMEMPRLSTRRPPLCEACKTSANCLMDWLDFELYDYARPRGDIADHEPETRDLDQRHLGRSGRPFRTRNRRLKQRDCPTGACGSGACDRLRHRLF